MHVSTYCDFIMNGVWYKLYGCVVCKSSYVDKDLRGEVFVRVPAVEYPADL